MVGKMMAIMVGKRIRNLWAESRLHAGFQRAPDKMRIILTVGRLRRVLSFAMIGKSRAGLCENNDVTKLTLFFYSYFSFTTLNTACLKAQKWFLGVGGAKKIILFMKFFLVGHTYPIITEFSWTKCESHLN